jgi:ABC-2 type transport system permease protein
LRITLFLLLGVVGMYNMIRADLFKIGKSSAVKILFLITCISAGTMAVMAYLIQKGSIGSNMSGIGFMFSDVNMISILGAVAAGILICGDFENKSIHNAISCGRSRGTVIVSKAIAFSIVIGFVLLPYAIATGIALMTGYRFDMGSAVGFLNILTKNSGAAMGVNDVLKLLLIMLSLMFVYAAQLSICVPIAFKLKKPVFVVAIYYGLTILFAQLTNLKDSNGILKDIFSFTPYGSNYTFLTIDSASGDILKAISVSLIYTAVILAVTFGGFRKSEIK